MNQQELENRLSMYLSAEKAILEGAQSYQTPDGTRYDRAGLGQIRREIANLYQQLAIVRRGGRAFSQPFVFRGRR